MIPYQADVSMERWPISNFLIIGVTFILYFLSSSFDKSTTYSLILCNGNVLGYIGHVFLHADLEHLLGNLIFLWVFGNAICSKFGNLNYLGLYFLFSLSAAIFHSLIDGSPAIGASGAVNGVIGAFLMLYPLNRISLFIWYFGPRFFSVSSIWVISFWLLFDIYGAISGVGRVAYVAHLGGFLGGATISFYALRKSLVKMEEHELSLVQYIKNKGELNSQNHEIVIEEHSPAPPILKESVAKRRKESSITKYKCPKCKSNIKGPSSKYGKKSKCPKCSTVFILRASHQSEEVEC
jgi:membrane associated rhomboid family serine protease/DNA-directed RNA polymerase subunit RPC12/RpoP